MNGASHHGALVIFGSGPGIGVHVASRFARGGFQKVVLLSRNAMRLSDDAFLVYSNAPQVQVSTVTVDLTVPSDLERALRDVEAVLDGTPIECVHYGSLELSNHHDSTRENHNAAKTSETWLLQESPSDLRSNLELSVISLYTVAQWAIPRLLRVTGLAEYRPALLVTSGWLAHAPEPNYFALGVCKSAQQNVILSLHNQVRAHGVHCGLVMVNSSVSTEAVNTNPANIAEESWKLYSTQGSGHMDVETNINEEKGVSHWQRSQQVAEWLDEVRF